MRLSRYDFMDKLSAFSFEYKTTHKEGHEIEFSVIAIDDIKQAMDEFMDDSDIIQIINSKEQLENNIFALESHIVSEKIRLEKYKLSLKNCL